MKVKKLMEILGNCDPETQVVLSADSEGNFFSPTDEVTEGVYAPDTTYSGEFYKGDNKLNSDNSNGAVCLWPTR